MSSNFAGKKKSNAKVSSRMASSSRSGNAANRERAANIDRRSTNGGNTKNMKHQGMSMLAESNEGQYLVHQPGDMSTMGATAFQPHITEMAPTTGEYPATQSEFNFDFMTSGCVAGLNSSNRHSAQQQQQQAQRTPWLHSQTMNSTIPQSTHGSVTAARGSTNHLCSRHSVSATAQQRYATFQNLAATNETAPSSAYSALAQPVYGPSVATKHSQFIDVVTNTGYMSPFELPERTTSLPVNASAPTDALSSVAREGGYITSLERISINESLEESSAAIALHNSISSSGAQPACSYPNSQQLLSAVTSAPRVALSPQPSMQLRQTRQQRSNQGSGCMVSAKREESMAAEEKDNHFSTQTEVPSTRSLSPHPAPRRRGAGAVTGETTSGLAMESTPLNQITKLRAASHQQHTNASMFSSLMGMTASTKAVGTPMPRDAHFTHHSHPDGDEDDVKACLNSKLVTPQTREIHILPDDNNSSAGAAPTPMQVQGLLTEPNPNVGNLGPTKKSASASATHINGVMQKLLHHIQMNRPFEHKSATNPTYAPAFSKGEGASSFASTNFITGAACSGSNRNIGNDNNQGDFASRFNTESNLASTVELNGPRSQRGRSRQGKESRQSQKQKHQREKKAALSPDATLTASSPTRQEGIPTNETPEHEVTLTEWTAKRENGRNGKRGSDANSNLVVSRSLQPSLMASIGTSAALPRGTGAGEPHLAQPRHAASPRPSELQRPLSGGQEKSSSPATTASSSRTSAAVGGEPRVYSILLEGHMGQRATALSNVPFARDACVLFEGDRGVDMGCVVQCEAADEKLGGSTREADLRAGNDKTKKKLTHTTPLVLRVATQEEQNDWLHTQVEEAQRAIQPCREAVESLRLPLTIVNAVYQFNREKLTFYYESDTRVDFRQLLQMMFARFYCRIWMERATPMPATAAVGDGAN